MSDALPRRVHAPLLLGFVVLLGCWFGMVEVQIEGPDGWAAKLPTWRITEGWFLALLGGRPLTGYHAWIFTFIPLVFHLPCVLLARWSWRIEARVLGCVALFWIIEDFAWFVENPAFGWARFDREHAWWHQHWLLGLPVDYWVYLIVGGALLAWSFTEARQRSAASG
jgi:hypothetical protein